MRVVRGAELVREVARGAARRVVAVDFGMSKCGMAVGDLSDGRVRDLKAFRREVAELPGKARSTSGDARLVEHVARLLREHEASALVVGFPLDVYGRPTPRCADVVRFLRLLSESGRVSVPVALQDEFGSSQEARERLRTPGRRFDQLARIDSTAARIILERFLAQTQKQRAKALVPFAGDVVVDDEDVRSKERTASMEMLRAFAPNLDSVLTSEERARLSAVTHPSLSAGTQMIKVGPHLESVVQRAASSALRTDLPRDPLALILAELTHEPAETDPRPIVPPQLPLADDQHESPLGMIHPKLVRETADAAVASPATLATRRPRAGSSIRDRILAAEAALDESLRRIQQDRTTTATTTTATTTTTTTTTITRSGAGGASTVGSIHHDTQKAADERLIAEFDDVDDQHDDADELDAALDAVRSQGATAIRAAQEAAAGMEDPDAAREALEEVLRDLGLARALGSNRNREAVVSSGTESAVRAARGRARRPLRGRGEPSESERLFVPPLEEDPNGDDDEEEGEPRHVVDVTTGAQVDALRERIEREAARRAGPVIVDEAGVAYPAGSTGDDGHTAMTPGLGRRPRRPRRQG